MWINARKDVYSDTRSMSACATKNICSVAWSMCVCAREDVSSVKENVSSVVGSMCVSARERYWPHPTPHAPPKAPFKAHKIQLHKGRKTSFSLLVAQARCGLWSKLRSVYDPCTSEGRDTATLLVDTATSMFRILCQNGKPGRPCHPCLYIYTYKYRYVYM